MKQVKEFDQLTRKSRKVTYISIEETDGNGNKHIHDMQLRHALQAMRVQPKKFKLAPGEKLPDGVSIEIVPIGTTIKDVEEFERKRGSVGKVSKTKFDDILEAIENGMDVGDPEAELSDDNDPDAIPGAMMSDEAPAGFIPSGVDLTPADSMLDKTNEEKALDDAQEEEPVLAEIQEKELNFQEEVKVKANYTKKQLEPLPIDQLQAILLNLPKVKDKSEKYQKDLLKGAKKGQLIDSIIQLSKSPK